MEQWVRCQWCKDSQPHTAEELSICWAFLPCFDFSFTCILWTKTPWPKTGSVNSDVPCLPYIFFLICKLPQIKIKIHCSILEAVLRRPNETGVQKLDVRWRYFLKTIPSWLHEMTWIKMKDTNKTWSTARGRNGLNCILSKKTHNGTTRNYLFS